MLDLLQSQRFREFPNYLAIVSDTSQSLTETKHPLNILVSLSMTFVAEAHRAEG
jgi:hypothetical protein